MFPTSKKLAATLLGWCLATHGICLAQQQDAAKVPAHLVNHAKQNLLPSGQGLAQRFDRDGGIESHQSVIFAESFEQEDFGKRWDETRNKDGKVLTTVEGGADGRQCLKVTAQLGRNTGGGMTKWFKSADTVYFRFYTKFDPQCDYVHHFCTLRANKGLRGGDRWSGFGKAGLKPDPEGRFSTALEPWGNWGRFKAPGKWNFYSYWHEMKPSPDGKYWGNSFRPEPQANIRKDEWICCEFMLKHNTPGKPDGEQAFWLDGRLAGHWKGINWRTSPQLMANAFTLESYVTDRWTKQKINIVYFDNLVIAREYIGPLNKPAPANKSSHTINCEGVYPHHLQGVCADDRAIYWSFTTAVAKTDRDGRLIRKVPVANHHGDLCLHDGKLFVAVNLGRFNDPKGNADSWVYVYDADSLKEIARHPVPQVFHGAGGVGFRDGRFFVVGGLPGDIGENYVYEYTGDFEFTKKHVIKSGHTHLGIQTATFAHGHWWFGCYGEPKVMLVTDRDFQLTARHERIDCSLGIAGLPSGQLLVASGSCQKGKGCTGSVRVVVPDQQRRIH